MGWSARSGVCAVSVHPYGFQNLSRLPRSGIDPVDLCGNRCIWFPYSSASCCSNVLAVVCDLYKVVSRQKHVLIEFFNSWRGCPSLSSSRFLHLVGNTASGFTPQEQSPLSVALFLWLLQLRVLSVRWGGGGGGWLWRAGGFSFY